MPNYGYLAHHGIEGQKWGKRNGPPYPLEPEDHSAAEKRANDGVYTQGVKQNRGEDTDRKKQEVPNADIPEQKKGIDKKKLLIGAGIAAGALAIVGGATIGGVYYANNKETVDAALKSIGDSVVDKFNSSKLGKSINESVAEAKIDREETKKAKGYVEKILSDNDAFRNNVQNNPDVYRSLLNNSKVMKNVNAAAKLVAMGESGKKTKGIAKNVISERDRLRDTVSKLNSNAVSIESAKGLTGKINKASSKLTGATSKISAPFKAVNKATNTIKGDVGSILGTAATGVGVYGYIKSKTKNSNKNQQNQQNDQNNQNQNRNNNYDNRRPNKKRRY